MELLEVGVYLRRPEVHQSYEIVLVWDYDDPSGDHQHRALVAKEVLHHSSQEKFPKLIPDQMSINEIQTWGWDLTSLF